MRLTQAARIILLSSIFLLGVATSSAQTDVPPQRQIIIDTDMAADDWMAILYLLQHPEIKVMAITVTGTGEAHCEPGVAHALGLLELANYEDIPVACGSETTLQDDDRVFPDLLRNPVDDLYGLTLPATKRQPSDQTAVELFTNTLQEADEPFTVITLGPLTNVAEALQAEPNLIDQIEMLYIMGGAVNVPGNTGAMSGDPDANFAEWNIYIDPRAANIVFQAGAPITLVPLDATNDAPVTMDFYESLYEAVVTPEAKFVYDILSQNRFLIFAGGYFFWDPLVAAIMTDETLTEFETYQLSVIEDDSVESGRVIINEDGAEIRVAVGADKEAFERSFVEVLSRTRD